VNRPAGSHSTPGSRPYAATSPILIPRYNAAGVRRFAFLFSDGMPAIGAPPAPERPATFPTGYFAHRQQALDWLAG
jgi:hypothetical protein